MTNEEIKKQAAYIEIFARENDLYRDAESYEDGALWARDMQKDKDRQLIDMLIDELYTSRAYHLGITGLDSDAEIARKEREGNTALIRGIDRTIKYVREAMEE